MTTQEIISSLSTSKVTSDYLSHKLVDAKNFEDAAYFKYAKYQSKKGIVEVIASFGALSPVLFGRNMMDCKIFINGKMVIHSSQDGYFEKAIDAYNGEPTMTLIQEFESK